MEPNRESITPDSLAYARQTLERYRQGKANLERRVVENEEWYKLRHWSCMRTHPSQVEPVSGWLFNAIANKHADAMDNYPSPVILPREEGDRETAEILSSIIPVILEQNDFEEVYDRVWDYKLKAGTGIYGVFWDNTKLGGLGDITIRKVDIINLFWESGITDIQQSRNLFHVELMDNDLLEQTYPQLQDKLGQATVDLGKYLYDDTVDCTGKSAVVDWYYKRGGKLHYCKFVGDTVLYASENDPIHFERGWYDHGQYPFVFDPLFCVEGTPCGFGYIDVGKSAQEYIDRGNQAILQNMLVNARPRHFIRTDGEVNEAEYADLSRDFIHVQGNLGQDSILPVQTRPLNDIYVTVINNKIDELKEVTGNRDVSTGGAAGVTAASAIAAMQEAGSKLSRDNNKAAFRAFRKVVLMVIELVRQFYNAPRCFRILGGDGQTRFLRWENSSLLPRHLGNDFGEDMGYRTPLFDVSVTAQKQSPYSRMSQNELALQFFGAGFFDPRLAEQALQCLQMMDFDRKDAVMEHIAAGAERYARTVAGIPSGTAVPAAGNGEAPSAKRGKVQAVKLAALGDSQESSHMQKARQRVANSTAPV